MVLADSVCHSLQGGTTAPQMQACFWDQSLCLRYVKRMALWVLRRVDGAAETAQHGRLSGDGAATWARSRIVDESLSQSRRSQHKRRRLGLFSAAPFRFVNQRGWCASKTLTFSTETTE